MDALNIETVAKAIAEDRLKPLADPAEAAEAAGLAAREISAKAVTGTQAVQPPRDGVAAACKGVMSAAVLLEKDLPRCAVAVLNQMGAVAQETGQDPAELMTWAMEGIAPVAVLAGEAARSAVQDAIESAFMGAGTVFSEICQRSGA